MLLNKTISAIRNNTIFKGDESSVHHVSIIQSDFVEFKEGEVIYAKDDPADYVYLVVEGKIKVKVYSETGASLEIKIKDDYFGEKELIEKTNRKSAALAESDSYLYRIGEKDFFMLLSKSSKVNFNLTGELDIPSGLQEEPEMNLFDEIHDIGSELDSVFDSPPPVDLFKLEQELESAEILDDPITGFPETDEPQSDSIIQKPEDHFEDSSFIEKGESFLETAGYEVLDEPEDISGISEEIIPPSEEFKDKVPEETESIPEELNYKVPEETESIPEELNEKVPEQGTKEENNEALKQDISDEGFIAVEQDITGYSDSEELNVIEIEDRPPVIGKKPDADELNTDDYKAILESLLKINNETTFEHIRTAAVEACRNLVSAEDGILFVVDTENKILRTKIRSGSEIVIGYKDSLAGYSAADNKIINLDDASSDPRCSNNIDLPEGAEANNILCLPVSDYSGNLIAVLQLFKKSIFSRKDIKILTSLMQAAALTIENALVYNHKIGQIKHGVLNDSGKFLISNIKPSLKGVKGYIDHLSKYDFSPEIKNILFMMNQYVDSMLKFGETFLNYTEGKSELKIKARLFTEVMNELLGLLAEYSELRYCKIFKKYDADGYVNIDTLEFYQACFQVVKNACDAMPEGGNIYVVIRQEDGFLYSEFRNTGRKIPDNLMPVIFEPFVTSKGNAAGLGLALANKIMKEHDGKIMCANLPGEGVLFRLYLPVMEV